MVAATCAAAASWPVTARSDWPQRVMWWWCPSATGWAPLVFWRWTAARPIAARSTNWPRCNGCSATSTLLAATRPVSRCSVNQPAATPCSCCSVSQQHSRFFNAPSSRARRWVCASPRKTRRRWRSGFVQRSNKTLTAPVRRPCWQHKLPSNHRPARRCLSVLPSAVRRQRPCAPWT